MWKWFSCWHMVLQRQDLCFSAQAPLPESQPINCSKPGWEGPLESSAGKRTGLSAGQYPGMQIHLTQGWVLKTGILYRDLFDMCLPSGCREVPGQPAPSLGCQEAAEIDKAWLCCYSDLFVATVCFFGNCLSLNNLKFCTQKLIKNPNYLLFQHVKRCRISLKSSRT